MPGRPDKARYCPRERKRYLDALQDGLAGLDEVRNVLAGATGRPEKGTLGWFIAAKMTGNKDG